MAHDIDPAISNWQAEEHELGMICFCPSEAVAKQFPYYELPTDATFLGLAEADALCLMDDGSLKVFDHEVADRVFCDVAPNQAAFVSALKPLVAYFEKCVEDEAFYEDEANAVAVRERCTEIAGGEKYEGFYCMMVGA